MATAAGAMPLQICVACGEACKTLKRCGSCKEKLYCSRECQVRLAYETAARIHERRLLTTRSTGPTAARP